MKSDTYNELIIKIIIYQTPYVYSGFKFIRFGSSCNSDDLVVDAMAVDVPGLLVILLCCCLVDYCLAYDTPREDGELSPDWVLIRESRAVPQRLVAEQKMQPDPTAQIQLKINTCTVVEHHGRNNVSLTFSYLKSTRSARGWSRLTPSWSLS